MNLERRGFFAKAAAVGVGAAALLRSVKSWAKGLPSDPGEEAKAGPDLMVLPGFDKNGTMTVDQPLLARPSSRNYDPAKELTPEQLSRILWAADGVNRPDGHRTSPSALAVYPVDIIAALPQGTYKYDLKKHVLEKVLDKDIRGEVPIQPGFKKAAMILLYVVNTSLLKTGDEGSWPELEIGCMVQNVYLMAAQEGLGSCVFALVQYPRVTAALGLKKNQALKIAQAVGPLT
jgi:nitroreductase